MNCEMKAIIKSVFLSVALAHATYAMCGTAISVYAGAYGDAILIDSGENKTLLVAGGAIPQGPATPSDCFAKATLHLKKRPNFYEGPLNPVRNEIIDVDANSVSGKRAGVYIYPSRIRIGNVEVNGICADGIDFSGDYKKVAEQSAKYASTFTYFMLERRHGRIVNVGSVNGSRGAYGQTNYSAAKAGVHGFTKALALETAKHGVTVNTVSPGYLATAMVEAVPREILDTKILPQIPVGRLGRPDEVAALIAFLCSEEAAFITGADIAINGGMHMQ